MSTSRRRTMTWLGVPVAALVAGGAGLAVASAASHPAATRLADTAAHASATPPGHTPVACSSAAVGHGSAVGRAGAAVQHASAVGRAGAGPAVWRVRRGTGPRTGEPVAGPEPAQRSAGAWSGQQPGLVSGEAAWLGVFHDHAGSGVPRYPKHCVIMKAALVRAPIGGLEIRKSNARRD